MSDPAPITATGQRRQRAVTLHPRRMSAHELAKGRQIYRVEDHHRPATRGDCEGGERPCPFVSCRYHLYVDVNPATGAMKLNFPHLEPDELAESCALDVAGRGGATLEEIGRMMNLTRERARQLEESAIRSLRERRVLEEGERGFVGRVKDIQGRPLAAPVAPFGEMPCKRCGRTFGRTHQRHNYCSTCRSERQRGRPSNRKTGPKSCEKCGDPFTPTERKRRYCDPCREAATNGKAPPLRRCKTCTAEFRPTHGRHEYCEPCRGVRSAEKRNRKSALTICGACGEGFKPNRKQMHCEPCRKRFGKPLFDAVASLRRMGFAVDIAVQPTGAVITATEAP